MPLPWYRFYTEFAHDPKIQTLPIPWRFAFVMILCWHAEEELSKLPDRVKAKIFEMTMEELEEMKETFTDLGFIENGWTPKNWEKRQRPSDNSAPRVQALRKRAKEAIINTLSCPSSDVTVTSPLRNRDVTEIPLISSSSSGSLREDNTRDVTVTGPLRNGDVTVTQINQPSYPDVETTMHHIDTGEHEINDATARDIWRRIWETWHDESLCIDWYRWQKQYPPDTWVAAFSQTKKQYGGQTVGIALVAKIAANIAAHGMKKAKPYAPDPGRDSKSAAAPPVYHVAPRDSLAPKKDKDP